MRSELLLPLSLKFWQFIAEINSIVPLPVMLKALNRHFDLSSTHKLLTFLIAKPS